MKQLQLFACSLVMVAASSTGSYSQTKAERKMKTTSMETPMYNSTESKEAKEFYDKGFECSEKEDYKNAVKWYKKSVAADDKFVEAYDNMGAAYRRMGDLDNAEKCYKKSIELYPQGSMAHQNLGIVYWIEKKPEQALEQYSIMQKNDSTDAEGYYGTIQIYFALKDYKSAIKNAAKTLEIYEATSSPYLKDAQYLLGLSYYYDGDNKNAKIYLEQAQKSGSKIPDALVKELDIK